MDRSRQSHAAFPLALTLGVSLAVAAGCGPRAAAPVAAPPPAADRSLDLAELARSIDPGRVPPLAAKAPPVLVEAFASAGGDGLNAEQLATQMNQLATGLTGVSSLDQLSLGRVMALVYMAGLLEKRLDECPLDCLAAAEQAYSTLDIPWLARPDAFLGQLLALGMLMQREMPADQGQAVVEYMRGTFEGAAVRHRSVAARILRSAPDSEAATAALRSLARRAERDGDYALAVRLSEAVLDRVAPNFGDLAELAGACVLAERLPCAERALVAARAAGGADQERIDSLTRDIASSRRIARLAGARGLDRRLERAHLLLDVGRHPEAIAELDALVAAHAGDARPLTGRARAAFEEAQSTRAKDLIARARGLANKDQRFYELAVGLVFERLMGLAGKGPSSEEEMTRLVVQAMPELRADVEGLARFSPGIGGVLRVVVGRLEESLALLKTADHAERRKRLQAITRGALADAMALRERVPREPDVYRLIFLAARFASPARDYSAAGLAIPGGLARRDEILMMQAGLLYSLAVSWSDGSRVDEIARALDAVSTETGAGLPARTLRADTMALQASMLGRAALWPDVAKAYRALADGAAPEERPRIQNNLGVALWKAGDRDGARAAWAEAIAAGEAQGAAQLNSTVTSETPDLRALDQIADPSERIGIQNQALRWKIAIGRLTGAKRRAALKRARELLGKSPVDGGADGSSGVVLEESFNVGVGYSSRERLVVQLYLGRSAFLLLPAPHLKKPARARTARR